MDTVTLEPGCYLDSHRGHYITRDMILFAKDHGYILDGFEIFVLDKYDDCNGDQDYPYQELNELSDSVIDWFNSGIGEHKYKCDGQNWPPQIPAGFYWAWNDGDFGLYLDEDLDCS